MGQERLVVDGVLVEGLELLEPGVHGTGPGVQSRVMRARSLGELLRIGRELVPKTIQIDPLTAGDQAFGVRSPEREMPERVVADDVVPGADARQRRIDDDEPADPRGILGGQRIPHYVPDIVGHEVGLIDLEGVQDAGDVVSLGLLVIAPGRPR